MEVLAGGRARFEAEQFERLAMQQSHFAQHRNAVIWDLIEPEFGCRQQGKAGEQVREALHRQPVG